MRRAGGHPVVATVAALVALAAAAAGSGGCGAARPAGPPRSTCGEAAASITQGLRLAAPADAERASELEPRFVHACRTSGWRANVVRCFALARDPAEHRICARRLEPAQREEAHVIQGALYGAPGGRERPARRGTLDGCRGLDTARDALLACDLLPGPLKVDIARDLAILGRAAGLAASGAGETSAADLAELCERRIDEVRRLLSQVGC